MGHEGWDAETGWKVDLLTQGQAMRLAEFIAGAYGRDDYSGLLRAIQTVTGQV